MQNPSLIGTHPKGCTCHLLILFSQCFISYLIICRRSVITARHIEPISDRLTSEICAKGAKKGRAFYFP